MVSFIGRKILGWRSRAKQLEHERLAHVAFRLALQVQQAACPAQTATEGCPVQRDSAELELELQRTLKRIDSTMVNQWASEASMHQSLAFWFADCPRVVQILIATNRLDVHCRNNNGSTVLFNATRHPESTRMVIEAGADVTAVNQDGLTALGRCVQMNDIESARVLLSFCGRRAGYPSAGQLITPRNVSTVQPWLLARRLVKTSPEYRPMLGLLQNQLQYHQQLELQVEQERRERFFGTAFRIGSHKQIVMMMDDNDADWIA